MPCLPRARGGCRAAARRGAPCAARHGAEPRLRDQPDDGGPDGRDAAAGEGWAWLVGGAGLVGAALAAIGLYGMIAYSVTRRTREIGIRLAVGSAPSGILRLVMRQGLTVAAAGVLLGVPLATGAPRWSRGCVRSQRRGSDRMGRLGGRHPGRCRSGQPRSGLARFSPGPGGGGSPGVIARIPLGAGPGGASVPRLASRVGAGPTYRGCGARLPCPPSANIPPTVCVYPSRRKLCRHSWVT